MSVLLALTICGSLIAVILVLTGWTQITRNASFDDAGAGPMKLADPFELPEYPHYGTNAAHLRAFRKRRGARNRKSSWTTSVRNKLQPLAQELRDSEGAPLELPDAVTYQQFEDILTELERRAGLAPLDPPSSP